MHLWPTELGASDYLLVFSNDYSLVLGLDASTVCRFDSGLGAFHAGLSMTMARSSVRNMVAFDLNELILMELELRSLGQII